MSLIVMIIQGFFYKTDVVEIMKSLCDSFFVPGMILICVGLLCFADQGGTFDMLAYGIRRFFSVFKRDVTKVKYRTFYEYRKAMQERDMQYGYILVTGILFVIVATVFLLLFYYYS